MISSKKNSKNAVSFLTCSRTLAFLAVLGIFFPSPAIAGDSGKGAILPAFQKKMDTLRDWQADFRQKAYIAAVDAYESSSGRVRIKKPGRILWEYLEPDRQILSSDGKKLFFYSVEDRQVIVRDLDANASAGVNLLFIAGARKIGDLFNLDLLRSGPQAPVRIKMTPKKAQANLAYLILSLDRASLRILSLQTFDLLQNNTLVEFSHVRENSHLSAGIFHFRIPKGTEVIHP